MIIGKYYEVISCNAESINEDKMPKYIGEIGLCVEEFGRLNFVSPAGKQFMQMDAKDYGGNGSWYWEDEDLKEIEYNEEE